MLDYRPTIYQMFWSHDEISTKCLSELVKNVKIDALKGLGVNQSQLKSIRKNHDGKRQNVKYKLEFWNPTSTFFEDNANL